MSGAKPTRSQADLADILELILDKGIVINADIAITVGETEMIGVELRAAIASFETAAEYGLAFPSGTDMRRVEAASGREPLEDDEEIDLGIRASSGGESESALDRPTSKNPPRKPPDPRVPTQDDEDTEETSDADGGDESEEDVEAENAEGDTSGGEQAEAAAESPETAADEGEEGT